MTPHGSLQAKFVGVILAVLLPFSFATLTGVTLIQYRSTQQRSRDTERRIEEGMAEKANVLTENHALALRVLVAENAFNDVDRLVQGAVERDPDIVYGLFVATDGRPWAYASPTGKVGEGQESRLARSGELGIEASRLQSSLASQRKVHLFGDDILEYAVPVLDDDELLGTVRYGLSMRRAQEALEIERARTARTLLVTLLTMGALTLLGIVLGSVLVKKALKRVARPLHALTDAAYTIAEGRRDVRVSVRSGDELEILATAFNQMLEANERAFAELETKTEQALEAARLKSEFLANVSHEIRTPMNGVTGLVKLMLEMPLEEKLRRYVETIDASSASLLTVINDVLDFSKMEAGKYVLHEAPFEPRVAIQEVVDLLGVRAAEKGVELIHRVAEDVPAQIRGDVDRFRQVLNNLVGNAVKFTEQGEIFVEVHVASRSEGQVKLHVSITDTGIGVAERDLATIFDAFSQVDGSLVRRHGGTGLGLAISKSLVEMMGGEIGVSSRLGVGSQFWFTFCGPVASEAQPIVEALPARKTALLIEANAHLRAVICEHLRKWGLACDVLHSANLADPKLSALLQSGKAFDVVIAGAAASATELRVLMESVEANARARVPLLAITQSAFSSDLADAGLPLLMQLHKPLRMSDLYNCLQKALSDEAEAPSATVRSKQKRLPGQIRKILVVEDNEINRFVAAEQLQELGYEVDLAGDGLEALEKVAQQDYLAVLMDCQMPRMDGYAATREIRRREQDTGRHQLIIALTAHALASERQRVSEAGMDDYLSKPLRGNALERMVSRYMRAAHSGAEPGELEDGRAGQQESGNSQVAQVALAPGSRRSLSLMRMCQTELPRQVAEVVAALDAKSAENVCAAAHKLKGAALALEAGPLAELAECVQHAAERNTLAACEDQRSALLRCLEDVQRALTLELASRSN